LARIIRGFLVVRVIKSSGVPPPRASWKADVKLSGVSGRDYPQDPVVKRSAVPEHAHEVADKNSVFGSIFIGIGRKSWLLAGVGRQP
jgi:hypothetical protein